MTGAASTASRRAARACASAVAVLAVFLACGKKGPLRLPDQRPPERAATPRASVSEGVLTLEFKVPSHRVFPEREEPWVLARIMRRPVSEKEFVEVGTILESRGFAFDEQLNWQENVTAKGASTYRVEFRDGSRRRRAVSDPVDVVWEVPPAAPSGLRAAGDDRAVTLAWNAPAGAAEAIRYRVYRREAPHGTMENVTAAPISEPWHTDSRVHASREYCYQVRAVLGAPAPAVEGPPSPEVCVRTEDATPPPPPAMVRVTAIPAGFQLTWEDVAAPDLLGYRVYRAAGEGSLELLTPDPIQGNAYLEKTREVPAGTRFRYVVTAVDNSARRNESGFSPAAEAIAAPPADGP